MENPIFDQISDARRFQLLQLQRAGLRHVPGPIPRTAAIGQPFTLKVSAGPAVPCDHVHIYYRTDGGIPEGTRGVAKNDDTHVLQLHARETIWDTILSDYVVHWEGQLVLEGGTGTHVHLKYVIEAWAMTGGQWYCGSSKVGPQVYEWHVGPVRAVPDWLRDAIIYQIFVDRFSPSPGKAFTVPSDRLSGFYGGTISGITHRLPYLAALGITCLWLTPIFPSPTHHGYDTTDYGTVEPRLGTDAEVDELFKAANQHGMHVVLDLVANHCSNRHPAFVAAQADRQAETYGWFTFRHWPDDYECFWIVREMPKLRVDNPAVRSHLAERMGRWLSRGCAGFRLDHAHGCTHAFWANMRDILMREKADSVMFGEVTEGSERLRSYEGTMDGVLDFVLLQGLRGFFAYGTLKTSEFAAFLSRHYRYFGGDTEEGNKPRFVLPAFLDNHDMDRFLFVVGGDMRRLRLASLLHYTLPAPPILYYGTEVAVEQAVPCGRLEESRMPMLWGDLRTDVWVEVEGDEEEKEGGKGEVGDRGEGKGKEGVKETKAERRKLRNQPHYGLLAYYVALGQLRRQHGWVVWGCGHIAVVCDDAHGVLVYTVGGCLLLALNNSQETRTVDLPLPGARHVLNTVGSCDVIYETARKAQTTEYDGSFTVDAFSWVPSTGRLTLPPFAGACLTLDPNDPLPRPDPTRPCWCIH